MSDYKAKMHKIRSPNPLAVFKGPTSKERESEEERDERKGRARPQIFWLLKLLTTP